MIDTPDDHSSGKTNIRKVLSMIDRARTYDDGTIEPNPTFKHTLTRNTYDNCLCGHNIDQNYRAVCEETGKGFIVGSDCIKTVCDERKYKLSKKCKTCKNRDSVKSKNTCKECNKVIKLRTAYVDFGKKHLNKTYETVYEDKSYCMWLLTYEYCGKEMRKFRDWVETVNEYPQLLDA